MLTFVIDTSIVFAGLLRESTTRELLIDSPFTLYAPETMLQEIRKHAARIVQLSGLSAEEVEALFGLLTDSIRVVERERYAGCLPEAELLLGGVDKGDVPFLALALSVPSNGIWTENVRHFGKQGRVKVWTTADVLGLLGRW